MLRSVTAVAAGLLLAGCGTTPEERGVSGAGIGASAGAIIGAVTGLSVLEGAVIGAVAGGLTGAATNKDTINMGEPVWKRRSSARETAASGAGAPAAQAAASATASTRDIRAIQAGLHSLGYNPGVADGIAGARTREAIRAYQMDRSLPVDGRPSSQLARHIDSEIRKLEQLSRAPAP